MNDTSVSREYADELATQLLNVIQERDYLEHCYFDTCNVLDLSEAHYATAMRHVRSSLAIARKHEQESQAWADVVTLLADLTLAD